MKTLFKLLLLVGILAYLVFAFTSLTGGKDRTLCRELNVVITDSVHAGFITQDEVARIIKQAKLDPVGKKMGDINSQAIERCLLANPFISMAQCYKTPDGRFNVCIAQRLPILRIMASNGDDYYMDRRGNAMKSDGYSADLPVATGNINRRYAATTLVHLARYIHDNSFADDLIEQIYVDEAQNVDLVPRIGCEVVHLGKADTTAIRQQMVNLKAFYTKVLPTVGWDAYSEISLQYAGQIVCKKHS